ncbi:hypothetical protein CDD80_6358 [Ophiocordyceps camponoti-rufipedis]|uniref:Uncharacterized protein n=1 Tax=Ophiocordyceps camponoti-rufipedis TaxID=2004952 RepID=A0A2C5ZFR9_9HYPO|nr:hypothetical protein CDD80_6358 [Ophiocordyceps camponoti-rufipedis]
MVLRRVDCQPLEKACCKPSFVIDISDLDSIRNCFLWFIDYEDDFENPDVPFPASEMYYTLGSLDGGPPELAALCQCPLIARKQLEEIWPEGRWLEDGHDDAHPPDPPRSRVPQASLKDQTIRVLVAGLLQQGDFEDSLLHDVQNMIGFHKILEKTLLENAMGVDGSPASIKLLQLVYGQQPQIHVDWTMFPNLTAEGASSALQHPAFSQTESLTLATSGSSAPDKLAQLFDGKNRLHTLRICSSTVDAEAEEADRLLYSKCAETARGLARGALYISSRFACALEGRLWLRYQPSPPPSDVFPVTQLLVESQGSLQLYAPKFESFFLGDALCSPTKAVNGLFRYIQRSCGDSKILYETGLAAAYSFASASSSLQDPEKTSIGPLPAEIYAVEKHRLRRIRTVRDITPNTWSILLVKDIECIKTYFEGRHEGWRADTSVKYAMVRSKTMDKPVNTSDTRWEPFTSSQIEVVGLPRFLELTAPYISAEERRQAVEKLHQSVEKPRKPFRQWNANTISLGVMNSEEACHLLNQLSANKSERNIYSCLYTNPETVRLTHFNVTRYRIWRHSWDISDDDA